MGELDGRSEWQDILDVADTALWWAGKELQGEKMLHEYLGKNEKTKVVANMQPKGSGAPARESRVDKETHSAMLQYYYKKQEEEKKMRENDDDSYLESSWADPKSLKRPRWERRQHLLEGSTLKRIAAHSPFPSLSPIRRH